MNSYYFLIPISLVLGGIGLLAFFWSHRDGQYDDLDGAAERILYEDDRDDRIHPNGNESR